MLVRSRFHLDRKEALFTYLLAIAGSWTALIGLVVSQQYASVFGTYALTVGAIISLVAGILGVLVYIRWPQISAYFKRFEQPRIIKTQLTPKRAAKLAIDVVEDGFDNLRIKNAIITSTKKQVTSGRELYIVKGKGFANETEVGFRLFVTDEKSYTIVFDPTCKVCGQRMTLLGEETGRWYCYKDDELFMMP